MRQRYGVVVGRRQLETILSARLIEGLGSKNCDVVCSKRYIIVHDPESCSAPIRTIVEIHEDDGWNFDVYPGLPVLVAVDPANQRFRISRRLQSNKKFVKKTT